MGFFKKDCNVQNDPLNISGLASYLKYYRKRLVEVKKLKGGINRIFDRWKRYFSLRRVE